MSAPRSQDDAAGVVASLRASGIAAVAVTIVDNAGIARVKTVPLAGLERFLGRDNGGDPVPADSGPAYGFAALAEVSEYARELIAAFVDSGIEIGQFHPEYVPGQLEVSLPLGDPVAAGDLNVVSRQLIRAVSAGHGWRASFSPVVVPAQVGNGGHLHFSLWRDGGNLLAGGHGPTA